jgi:hypothetical protein
LVGLAARRTHGQKGPEYEGKWKPDARANFLNDEAMGYLADNQSGSENRQQNAVFVAFEANIFAETSDIGIGESLTVCFVSVCGARSRSNLGRLTEVVKEVACTAIHLVNMVRQRKTLAI